MPFGWETFAELLRTLAAWRADPDALPRGHQGRLVSFSPPGHTGENGFIGFGDLRVFLEKDGFASFADGVCALAEQGPLAEAIAALKGSWTDNGDGTYAATFTAQTAGTGLTAQLKLANWGTASQSAAYTITASSPVAVNSAIATDAVTYASGDDMALTVTLKDAQANPVTGASAQLTATAVTVANAALKGGWADNGDGTYAATYTAQGAGTGLVAGVKLAAWGAGAQSTAYTITAGAPVAVNSAIDTDASRYSAGDDMTLTVTLKDAQANPVTGASAQLTAASVTVANASLKAGSSWSDNGNGTYAATYTAQGAGTGLVAGVKLAGWSTGAQSSLYAITAGPAAAVNSGIITTADSYRAGLDAIEVVVTLRDAYGNPVTGAASELTATTVTVPDSPQIDIWYDNGDGTYTSLYRPVTTGSGLVAEVKLAAWGTGVQSAPFAIIPGEPDARYSTIATNASGYVQGDDIEVTVMLKDRVNNPTPGYAALITVQMGNAANPSQSSWTDHNDGTYTATLKAGAPGTSLKAVLFVSSELVKDSATYDIVPVITIDSAEADYHTFAKADGFPTTGFTGASFKLKLTGGIPSELTWSSDASWVSVTDGVVTFTGTGNGNKVTISAIRKNGLGEPVTYAFTLKKEGPPACGMSGGSTGVIIQVLKMPASGQ